MQVANVMGTQHGSPRYRIGSPVVMPVHSLDNAPLWGGRVAATPEICNQIICGFIPQAEAGQDLLYACSQAGHVGARPGCADPMCRAISSGQCNQPPVLEPRPEYIQPPTANTFPFSFPRPTPVVDPRALTPPLPSISPARRPEVPVSGPLGSCGFAGWVDDNKGIAVALVVAGYLVLNN